MLAHKIGCIDVAIELIIEMVQAGDMGGMVQLCIGLAWTGFIWIWSSLNVVLPSLPRCLRYDPDTLEAIREALKLGHNLVKVCRAFLAYGMLRPWGCTARALRTANECCFLIKGSR